MSAITQIINLNKINMTTIPVKKEEKKIISLTDFRWFLFNKLYCYLS